MATALQHLHQQWIESAAQAAADIRTAACNGDLVTLQRLLSRHPEQVNGADQHGRTALHGAARGGHEECVNALLAFRAGPGPVDMYGETPLHQAAFGGHGGCVCALLGAGANATAVDSNLQTPLHMAAASGDEACIKALLARPHNLEAADSDGQTPLHRAAHAGKVACINILMAAGSNLTTLDWSGLTPLMLALKAERTAAAGVLARLEVDWQRLVAAGQAATPTAAAGVDIHTAARDGNRSRLSQLLSRFPSMVNAVDSSGRTPLHHAAASGHDTCVRVLLAAGANAKAADAKEVTALHLAASRGHEACTAELLVAGADMEAAESHGWTALHLASSKGHEMCLCTLLAASANTEAADETGMTALHWAAFKGHEAAVRVLLTGGASTAAVNHYGKTALHYAVSEGHEECAEVLLATGADVEAADSDGWRPLHWAASWGRLPVVRCLARAGANLAARDEAGDTPCQVAEKAGHVEAAVLLHQLAEDAGASTAASNTAAAASVSGPRATAPPQPSGVASARRAEVEAEAPTRPATYGGLVSSPSAPDASLSLWHEAAAVDLRAASSAPARPLAAAQPSQPPTAPGPAADELSSLPSAPHASLSLLGQMGATDAATGSPGWHTAIPCAPPAPSSLYTPSGSQAAAHTCNSISGSSAAGSWQGGLPSSAPTSPWASVAPATPAQLTVSTAAITPLAGNAQSLPAQLLRRGDASSSSSATDELRDALSAGSRAASGVAVAEGMRSWEVDFQELELGQLVGDGSFGKVFLADWHQTQVAVKVLTGLAPPAASLSDPLLEELHKEAGLMVGLRHPNCVALMGICSSPAAIVTEYCARGSLFDVLREASAGGEAAEQLTWERRLHMAIDAAKGMLYLHTRKPPILHRDLKTPNLLVDEHWRVKVSDFNLSKALEVSSRMSAGGVTNPLWMAPEMLDQKQSTAASDVYAFAVILWELLTWRVPYADMNPYRIAGFVLDGGRLEVPPAKELPGTDDAQFGGLEQYVALMRRCWDHNPAARPTFHDIIPQLRSLLSSTHQTPAAPSRPSSAAAAAAAAAAGVPATRECRVCLEECLVADLRVLIPCGHNPACAECTEKLLDTRSRCPVCRAQVTDRVKVYDC